MSKVNDIPKGSRLAVSTNLLGCLIAVLMRATGQVSALEGGLELVDQRLITARAILGEWLGGSGGGWQDSGGVWPGVKRIEGMLAGPNDPENGISRGRLLPHHTILRDDRISAASRKALQNSLVLVYGGMAQNVGPILEMVTEKYLVRAEKLRDLLKANGFDREQHEQIRADLLSGRIGLSENRLPPQSVIQDVSLDGIVDLRNVLAARADFAEDSKLGQQAIEAGQVAVVSLAAGVGSRWTGGAGVVKGMHPLAEFAGKHRSFIEVHLAKSRLASELFGCPVPHVFTTGYMTHEPIEQHLATVSNYGYTGPVYLSRGVSVGLRTIPTARDLRFFWEEMPHQVLTRSSIGS